MMKALAIETIFLIIIATASAMLFIALVGFYNPAFKSFFCNFYMGFLGLFSRQVTVPETCKKMDIPASLKTVEVCESDKIKFSRILLSYIIACWKMAEIRNMSEDSACYEIKLKCKVDDVSEENITYILKREDRCKSIENSDFNCGERNQILWKVGGGIINTQQVIIVRYSGKNKAIEVIA
ncbi:MAG: hypothetical protein QXT38_01135 [Candidatus Aenigmatarchaeota archaeon]